MAQLAYHEKIRRRYIVSAGIKKHQLAELYPDPVSKFPDMGEKIPCYYFG